MSAWQLLLRSLRYHWRINLAVALGVAVATGVLTGALVVGDSVRGSLEQLALDRLGQIDDALVASRFFRSELAADVAAQPGFDAQFERALPAILLQGSVKNQNPDHPGRSGQVTVIGCAAFGTLGPGLPREAIPPGEVVLNEPLARKIHAAVGDEIMLRIGQIDLIPPDSPLGRKKETVRSRRLLVRRIVPAEGLGRFGLRPTQLLPYNAYVAAETLAGMLDAPDKANVIFVAGGNGGALADDALESGLHPRLIDYGYTLERAPRGYWQFAGDRLVVEPAAEDALLDRLAACHPQPVLTYLANWIKVGAASIPYSTVSAIDFVAAPPLGPFTSAAGDVLGPLADGDIALNTWAADDLQAKVGDEVELTYFEPESTHGDIRQTTTKLRLAAIVAMDGAAADRKLTPEMKGITDQTSIGDWNPPFPFDAGRVRKKDEKYWDEYRALPKAFVSLATGRRLWASRFGRSTSIRLVADEQATADNLSAQLELDPADFGLRFLPVRRMAQFAATGTTPFSVLFLSFSFFIIAAAVMLVAILFQLGIQQRAAEFGLLLALGVGARRAVRLLAAEGLAVAAVGAIAGVVLGVGYAWLMLAGLRTWWLGAISTPFLQLYVAPISLLVGYLVGIAVTAATIFWTARRMRKLSVRQLLAGQAVSDALVARGTYRWWTRGGWGLCVLAAVLGFAATGLGGEAQAGAFFTSGMLVLTALLVLLFVRLRSAAARAGIAKNIGELARRNGNRNPMRSTLSVGLVAAASFLIVATSAFRLDPEAEARGRAGGSGGFALVAQSDQPVYQDLNSQDGRDDLGFSAAADKQLAESHAFALRVHAGDDASCLNLYQPTQPRVLGVSQAMIERGGFGWAASAAATPEDRENPWLLLDRSLPASSDGIASVPVVLDLNTAMYSLHLWQGVGEHFEINDDRGRKIRLEVVGLLANSIFQGDVLMSERQFLAHFPSASGFRMFLVDTPAADVAPVREVLEETLQDFGFDAQPAVERLAGFMAVQNTYLSTFQSLGGLGLLLGTVGLAIVQLRSVLERRGELALMQAVGFRRRRLAEMVLLENALLLAAGLAIGVAAAMVAVLPHLFGGAAAIPWAMLALTLSLVLLVGLAAGLLAVRAVLRAELLPALRAE
jgi:putative ABC transport system permease protein